MVTVVPDWLMIDLQAGMSHLPQRDCACVVDMLHHLRTSQHRPHLHPHCSPHSHLQLGCHKAQEPTNQQETALELTALPQQE